MSGGVRWLAAALLLGCTPDPASDGGLASVPGECGRCDNDCLPGDCADDAPCRAFQACLARCGGFADTQCFEECPGGHPIEGRALRLAVCLQQHCAQPCRGGGGCTPRFGPCGRDAECCQGQPCIQGYCGGPGVAACRMAGDSCEQAGQCCSLSCRAGSCCTPVSGACDDDWQCCGVPCKVGSCGDCLANGALCNTTSRPCCTGECRDDHCVLIGRPPQCAQQPCPAGWICGDGGACCLPGGFRCAAVDECCSRSCLGGVCG
jgi:hypothetical protein